MNLFIITTLCTLYRAYASDVSIGGFTIALWNSTGTIGAMNKSVTGTFNTYNNFSFVPRESPRRGCHNLGDVTIRIRPTSATNGWSYFSSASGTGNGNAPQIHSNDPKVVIAYNISSYLSQTADLNNQRHDPFYNNIVPLQVIRSYEKADDGNGFILRFNITNTIQNDIEIGALGFAMPAAGQQHDIEQSVWNDPHIGLDHGWVEWSRIVVDEQVMLAFPTNTDTKTAFEAWRPIMENTCGKSVWEYGVHSLAWAQDWKTSTQWPYLYMSANLNRTNMWPRYRIARYHTNIKTTHDWQWYLQRAAIVMLLLFLFIYHKKRKQKHISLTQTTQTTQLKESVAFIVWLFYDIMIGARDGLSYCVVDKGFKTILLFIIGLCFKKCLTVNFTSGGFHSCALSNSQAVKCWGRNDYGQLGYGDNNVRGDEGNEMGISLLEVDVGSAFTPKRIAGGYHHTCALSTSNAVKCWGRNEEGQLGYGDMDNRGDGADEMGDSLLEIDLGIGFNATQIAAGFQHTCALSTSNAVKCWGSNEYGQLGYGDTNGRGGGAGEMGNILLKIDLGIGFNATQIVAGYFHTCAVSTSNAVKCWGRNDEGHLGYGDTNNRGDGADEMGDSLLEIDLGTGFNVTQIAAGFHHTCAVSTSHAVKCWGGNLFGELGYGDTNDTGDGAGEMGNDLLEIDLGIGFNATQIVTGKYHTCALSIEYAVKCWGNNMYGQLGYGDTNNRDEADEMGDYLLEIDLGTGFNAIQIAAGYCHTCALSTSQAVKCWGRNDLGQLGSGDTNTRGDEANEMGNNLLVIDIGSGFTAAPTNYPSSTPTNYPSTNPTNYPSLTPTLYPSRNPTTEATVNYSTNIPTTYASTTTIGSATKQKNNSMYIVMVVIVICLIFGVVAVIIYYKFKGDTTCIRSANIKTVINNLAVDSDSNNYNASNINNIVEIANMDIMNITGREIVIGINKTDEMQNEDDIIMAVNTTYLGSNGDGDIIVEDSTETQKYTICNDEEHMEGVENDVIDHEGINYDMNEDGAKDVKIWLDSIGLGRYYDIFVQNGFDSLEMLQEINDQKDLNNIGITLKGHQLKIMNHIKKININ